MKIDSLIKLLICPYCKGDLHLLNNNEEIVCSVCDIRYSVVDGVPILMKLDKLEKQERKQLSFFNKHYFDFPISNYKLENWRLSMLNRILDNDFSQSVSNYLDIGCGATGYTAIESVKRNNWTSIGTDISIEAMIKASHRAEKEGVQDKTAFIVCSAENLPFRKNFFDYISAISVLEHIDDDEKVIDNISFALRDKGYVYICVPNTYLRMWPFLWPIYVYHDIKIGHKRHYSVEGLTKKFIGSGFKKYTCFYNGHLIKLYQLVLDKLEKIDDSKWWELERKDINDNSMGLQMNVIYQKL